MTQMKRIERKYIKNKVQNGVKRFVYYSVQPLLSFYGNCNSTQLPKGVIESSKWSKVG